MVKQKLKLLFVDDEENNLMSFKATFRMEYDVFTAISVSEGRKILEKEPEIGVVVSDQRMPGETGIELFESILQVYPDTIRILLTGYTDMEALINAINKGQIYRYLQKPWKAEELKSVIDQAFELFALRKENQRLTEELIRVNKQLEFLYRQTLIN